MKKKLNSLQRLLRTTAGNKQNYKPANIKKMILFRSTVTFWRCVAQVMSSFVICCFLAASLLLLSLKCVVYCCFYTCVKRPMLLVFLSPTTFGA